METESLVGLRDEQLDPTTLIVAKVMWDDKGGGLLITNQGKPIDPLNPISRAQRYVPSMSICFHDSAICVSSRAAVNVSPAVIGWTHGRLSCTNSNHWLVIGCVAA